MGKKVSVVTVCYNAEEEIAKTLDSVLHLDYSDFEYIIVDGLSADRTCDIIQTYLPLFREKKWMYPLQVKRMMGFMMP